ncbi:hypothetical protein HET73_01210 [Wolbachia endosymbiont of Atemnus politus]|uniref:hypothetical protein n=2 Tax=Wolbachia endosymbiont of Atemnus politus TaxID=2682840 RepID=UPI0015736EA6|nr:hypothetical protein [Wolbachia endosymbiont of Atemnus politus]NSM56270.1 hypothetical protein [Wolbachia endosymbiont of Atemnus politus]
MNDDYLFENNSEENNDDRRERSLKDENQLEEQQKDIVQDYLKAFEDILTQIDEEIDNLDSYERTMQVKRSIDRLIETLYSQAASEDIDAEFETTKHTRNKLESKKRVMEKRKKQVMEEILSGIQQQKELMNAKRLNQGHEAASDGDIQKARMKSSIRGVLFSVIAHRMDPKRRAGETADDNEKQARIHGREAVGGALGALLKAFLAAVTAAVREIAKPLQKQETSFSKQVEESRNTDSQKGRSV